MNTAILEDKDNEYTARYSNNVLTILKNDAPMTIYHNLRIAAPRRLLLYYCNAAPHVLFTCAKSIYLITAGEFYNMECNPINGEKIRIFKFVDGFLIITEQKITHIKINIRNSVMTPLQSVYNKFTVKQVPGFKYIYINQFSPQMLICLDIERHIRFIGYGITFNPKLMHHARMKRVLRFINKTVFVDRNYFVYKICQAELYLTSLFTYKYDCSRAKNTDTKFIFSKKRTR